MRVVAIGVLSNRATAASMSEEPLSVGDLRAATLTGLRWAVLSRPIVECLGMASLVVCARLISPAEFGRYAIALIVLGLGSVTGQGVGIALVQRKAIAREHLQAGLALALLSGLALVGLILIAARFVVAPIYGNRTGELVMLIAPIAFINAVGLVPTAILQRRLEFRRLTTLSVFNSVVTAATTVPMAAAGLQGVALVLGQLAGAIVGTILLWVWTSPPLPRLHKAAAKELLGYGGPASLAAVSWVGFQNCDYAIVGARLGALQAGLYYRAYTVAVEYQKKVSQLMDTLGFPLLSRAQTGNDQRVLRGRMVRLETLVLFPALALLAIIAPVLIPFFFGADWQPAVVPTQILAVGGAATLVIDAVGAHLMATGRGRALLGYGWGHFAAYATAVWFLAPLGLSAVAVGAAVVHSAFVLVAYVLLVQGSADGPFRRLGAALKELWEDVEPALVSCVGLSVTTIPLALILSAARVPPVIFLAVVGIVGVVTYVGVMRVVFPSSLRSLGNLLGHLLPERRLRWVSRRLRTAETHAAP